MEYALPDFLNNIGFALDIFDRLKCSAIKLKSLKPGY